MQVVEEYGRTVDEAVQKALTTLGVGEDKVAVDIIDPGRKATSSGFGAKFARVKVTLKEAFAPLAAPPPPRPVEDEEEEEVAEESRPVAVPAGRGGGRGRGRRGDRPDRGDRGDRPEPVDRGERDDRDDRPEPVERGERVERDRDEPEQLRDREPNRERGRRPAPVARVPGEDDDDEAPAFKPVRPESPDADEAEQVLKEILRMMGVEAEVERDYDRENAVRFNVIGEDLGALIGKYGQTIEAIQYLVNLIASRQNESYDKVSIDIEGYRERRERSLEELATRMARKVRTDGKSVTLEPMLPSERRIIHMALSDDPAVRTYSQGEEPMRKVVISPARRGGSR